MFYREVDRGARVELIVIDRLPTELQVVEAMRAICEDRWQIEDSPLPDVRVSTVFVGIDVMAAVMHRRPRVYETMVFGGVFDREQIRYTSRRDALRGHFRMRRRVLAVER